MENSKNINNVIIKAIKNEDFKKRLLENPKQTIEEDLQIKFPDNFEINTHENTNNTMHIVIPFIGQEELSEQELQSIAGGATMDPKLFVARIKAKVAAEKQIPTEPTTTHYEDWTTMERK